MVVLLGKGVKTRSNSELVATVKALILLSAEL